MDREQEPGNEKWPGQNSVIPVRQAGERLAGGMQGPHVAVRRGQAHGVGRYKPLASDTVLGRLDGAIPSTASSWGAYPYFMADWAGGQ